MKLPLIVLLVVGVAAGSFAGEQSVVMRVSEQQDALTGNLQVDLFGRRTLAATPLQSESPVADQHRKSPWLAAGLSLVIPGAGEFYAGSYWKAALFLAIDVAGWTLAYHFDKKGDTQTDFFQGYANQNWSVVQYAQFTLDTYVPDNMKSQYDGLIKPGSESLSPWQRVNWNILNRLERDVSATAEGRYYSHTLPPYGDQQYFELIGKYQQFYQGWNDADPALTTYDQIEARIMSGGTKLKYYAGERGKANDYYTTATTYVTVAIVNHVVSALDAAWTAASYNRNLHASVRLQSIPTAYGYAQVPVARMEYSF